MTLQTHLIFNFFLSLLKSLLLYAVQDNMNGVTTNLERGEVYGWGWIHHSIIVTV